MLTSLRRFVKYKFGTICRYTTAKMKWTHVRQYSSLILGISTGACLAYYYTANERAPIQALRAYDERKLSKYVLWDKDWDGRDPKSIVRPMKNETPEEKDRYNNELQDAWPIAVRHIVLVRHGEYYDYGSADITHQLTERGRLQAKYTGKRLKELGIKWHKIIASTMTRAQETAQILTHEMGYSISHIENCALICEGAPLPPQPPVGKWRPDKSFFRDGVRIEAGFRRYFHRAAPTDTDDTYTLIVAHSNVIRYFVCRALQFPPEAWMRLKINHASITWLTINPSGTVTIKYLGDSGFIPAKHLTESIPRRVKDTMIHI